MSTRKSRKVQQSWLLFIVTFLVSLIVITYFIKSYSPNVDVEIGNKSDYSIEGGDSDSDVKQAIDDRLRWIQMEDNLPGASVKDESNKDETTETIESEDEQIEEKVNKKNNKQTELPTIEYVAPKTSLAPPVPTSTEVQPFKMAKVYVGSYPTIEQAIQAQTQLLNSTVSVSPFVKEINGSYVLQAGSYANVSKAEALANEINAAGFSARVVKE